MNSRFLIISPRRTKDFSSVVAIITFFAASVFAADVLDRDGDGMSDVWQRVYNIATGDTASDPDADGQNNAQEARAGTNPHDFNSRLKTIAFTLNTTATTATLTWKSENGKNYDIEYSADLAMWTHSSFVTGNGANKTATITLAAAARKFYRIRARQTEDDTDSDTLTNWEENLLGTSKGVTDSDGDGMHDDWEFIHHLSPLLDDAYADADADGVPNIAEWYYKSNPQDTDSDDDGLSDQVEFPWSADLDSDGLTNQQEILIHNTRADKDDTDADGLADGWEVANNLNPTDSTGGNGATGDPDGDTLNNSNEQVYDTDPNDGDSDDDGASDKVEVTQGSNPNDASDGGQHPDVPPGEFTVTWGDPSTSRSEKYRVSLTCDEDPEAPYYQTNKNYGEVSTYSFAKVKKGKKYILTMTHQGTNPDYRGKPSPDFDYTLNVGEAPCLYIDDPSARAPASHGMLGSHANDEAPHADGSFWAGGKEVTLAYPTFEWATPKGSPVTAPDDSLPGQNEFTYNSLMPGVVTLTFDIVVKPPGISEGLIDKNMVAFLQPTPGIGGSTFDWSLSNPNGKPVANGDNLRANATYTTLPADNAQFGLKTAHFACSGVNIPDTNFEVFYTGIEFNHPGGDPTQPNWFFYYKQNAGGGAYGYEPDAARRSNSISAGGDVSIAIAREAYTGDAYYLTATVAGRLKVSGASGENRWYANFIGILAHERFHANQQTNDPAIDADRDNLSDAFETGTSMTDPNDDESATRGTGLFQGVVDHEIYAGGPIEAAGIAGADTTKDWASPGTNNKTH